MLRHVLAVLVVVGTAVAVPRAQAADPTAQAFVDTVALGSVAINGTKPQVREAFKALEIDRCVKAIDEKAPGAVIDSLFDVAFYGTIQATFKPSVPAMQAIVAGLDRIPTSDPALRSGRAAWRATAETMAKLPAMVQPCRKLEAWKKRKWQGKAPTILPAGAKQALAPILGNELDRKFERASKRLRALGISKADAKLWAGGVFDELVDEVEAVVNEVLPDETGESGERPFQRVDD
jgi:hypothetical protein